MKKYLEYKDDKSQKIWEIILNGKEFITRYGKIGADGSSKNKVFESANNLSGKANIEVPFIKKYNVDVEIKQKEKTNQITIINVSTLPFEVLEK